MVERVLQIGIISALAFGHARVGNPIRFPCGALFNGGRTASFRAATDFEPEKFEDHYEEALVNAKRNGRTIGAKPRPKADNVVNLMDVLKKSIASGAPKGKKPRKAAAGQKEMLLPIEGKRPAAKKAAKPERTTGRRKAG